jgi:hypothetical protein
MPRTIFRYVLESSGWHQLFLLLLTVGVFLLEIDVIPGTERGQFELTAYGRLAELTAITTAKRSANISSVSLVAGEGFEPPTLGL